MKHVFLLGEYDLSVDEKGRFLIPMDIRKRMDPERDGEAFYLVIGPGKRPWLYPEKVYERILEEQPIALEPSSQMLDRDRRMFGTAAHLPWDKQGRVLIPETTRKRTNIKGDITLVGVRDHLELWLRESWSQEQDRLFEEKG